MTPFAVRDGRLHAESVPLEELARRFGTPCFVYSRAALESAFRAFSAPLAGRDHLVCYAMKANSNLAVLDVFARLGAGFDIVSGGELARVVAAGGDPRKVVFSGVGKSVPEIGQALAAGILCFNVESEGELERIERIAGETGRRAPVSMRVNPDVDPKTHPYISTGLRENKFGVPSEDALRLYRKAAASRHLAGGRDRFPRRIAADRGGAVRRCARQGARAGRCPGARGYCAAPHRPGRRVGHPLSRRATRRRRRSISGRCSAASQVGRRRSCSNRGARSSGNAGVLLTRVEHLKHAPDRNFAIVDAAMNDLVRPALYDAWHDIVPVARRSAPERVYEVVGPVCETGDFLGHARPLALAEGDLLAILSAGAYGMVMSSNYNTRPRAPEVMVDGASAHLVRERESVSSLFATEHRLP